MVSVRLSLPLALAVAVTARAQGGSERYLRDFEFLADTIQRRAAVPKWKGIDVPAVLAAMRPRFAACTDDVAHVRNAMELLAALRDSHTGITRSKIRDGLPGRFDGLYGGGLWFGHDAGKWVVRGVLPGHALGDRLPLGSVLLAVEGEPAWLALGRVRCRVARFLGISSDHSFFASLGNRLLPFGDAQQLACTFVRPDGKSVTLDVPRWGPGGKAFAPGDANLPPGVARRDGAVSSLLECDWSKRVGYLAITGSMDDATVRAFDTAFDALRGMDALLLDCRGMGGGGDASAWAMNGRLFAKAVANGASGRIEPGGAWQFEGPVVMLQDELEVSSAETFTWGLAEHDRVVSVGRHTGGWAIIPNVFDAPSGLFSFRLGVTDRGTPVEGRKTEGVGYPPDVVVPFGPVLTALGDPTREVGLAVLACLHAGAPLAETRAAFHALAEGDAAAFARFARGPGAKAKGVDLPRLAQRFEADLAGEIALETAIARHGELPPDALGLQRRAARLIARANAGGAPSLAKEVDGLVMAAKKEAAAQAAFFALPDPFAPDGAARAAFARKHAGTATVAFLQQRVWKGPGAR